MLQFKTDKLYIWPIDGLINDEEGRECREIPLIGYFAVKFGRGALERAMSIFLLPDCRWEVKLDGFMCASPSLDWRIAFGKIWEAAEKRGNEIFLGRRLSEPQYTRLLNSRAADKERGIDLSAAVDLNSVEIPFTKEC